MSEQYGSGEPTETDRSSGESSGKIDAAKEAASGVKDTTAAEAGHVVETVKDEAANVAVEAKSQVKDLYAQTQRELKEQAGVQQQRVAVGLRSVGDELDSLASKSETDGVATDLVRQVSARLTGAASWLGDRDPGSVLAEVKSYARRKPGTFIAVAAITGVVVGRLTRALAAAASEESGASVTTPQTPSVGVADVSTPVAYDGGVEDTPVFAQSSAARGAGFPQEGTDVRSDTF